MLPLTCALASANQNEKKHSLHMPEKTRLPLIIEQLKTKNPIRRAIDIAVLQVLEINGNQEQLLYSVYDSISRTMETLATLMKEGRVGD
jgi:CTP-dependent riboflavin kinase